MNWDKKTITAMLLCIVLFTGYMAYLQKKYPDYYAGQRQEEVAETQATNSAASTTPSSTAPTSAAPSAGSVAPAAPAEAVAEISKLSEQDLRFETKTRIIQFDQNTSAIDSIQLKDYQQDLVSKTPAELLDSPLVVQGTTQIADRQGRQGFSAKRAGNTLSFTRTSGVWEITQSFTVPEEGYGLDVNVQFKNTSNESQELTSGVLMQENLIRQQTSGGFLGFGGGASAAQNASLVYGLAGKHNDTVVPKFCDENKGPAFTLNNEKVDFIGVDKHYFLSFLWAKGQATTYVYDHAAPSNSFFCPVALMAYQNLGLVQPGASANMALTGYFGPKQLSVLEAFDPALKPAMKLGWFSVLARPLLIALKAIYGVVGNYGIAIILATLLLKLLFYPLTKSAAVSMKKMQKLQPEINRLRDKFKDDPQRQQREMMAFMSQHKVNPFKGCLPILPQIPVFIAFYNVLSQSIELRHAPFYGWLQDLAVKDPYYVTPLLLGAGMFLQQKLTPNPGMDKNQEKIMLMMPLIFTAMMLSLPAGMVLYMITNTVVSILQQQWLNKRLAKQFG